jgi:hypothetical protein
LFDMANDSGLFRTRDQLEAAGWRLDGNVFVRGDERYLPLYEAKMVHQFDHRFGDYAMQPPGSKDTQLPDVPLDRLADPDYRVLPRYWVPEAEVEARLAARGWDRGWLLGWRDITNVTNERTVIAAVIPRVGVGHKFLLLLLDLASNSSLLLASLTSLALDYAARQKLGGTSLTYFTLKQLPLRSPGSFKEACSWERDRTWADWLRLRVLELTYTAWDLQLFAQDLGWSGPPFRYDPERRFLLRAELDAAFFHLYLGTQEEWIRQGTPELLALFPAPRDAVDYILDTFPIVRRRDATAYGEYRTKRVILEIYDAMADAIRTGVPYQTVLDPPPADPAVAYPPRPGEAPGRWVPIEERVPPAGRPRPRPVPAAPARSAAIGGYAPAPAHRQPERLPRAAEPAAPTREAQATLDDLTRAAVPTDGWLPENAIDLSELRPGLTVRHPRFGKGTIIGIHSSGRSPSVVIRFASGEREIQFGLGMLEFAR